MEYVIKEKPASNDARSEGYYTGKKYVVQSEPYYIFTHDIEKAKKYSTRKRAENAINSLYRWNVLYELVVEKVGE
jgi:hypothetical protein